MDVDEVRRYWDEQADRFDEGPDHGLGDPTVRAAWLSLLQDVLPPIPARIADLGTGTGTLAVLLAQHGYRVDGVDLSPRMIALAVAKAQRAGADIGFSVGDAGLPQLPAGIYDVVLVRHLLWTLPDPATAVRRWFDLLRRGGRLVVIEGCWATGGGLHPGDVEALIRPFSTDVVIWDLSADDNLWGAAVNDERFIAVATT